MALYVHVPFCTSRCRYCAFYSGEPLGLVEPYPAWVLREASLRARAGALPGSLSSVYLGGGTPALLGGDGVARLLGGLAQIWPLTPDAEVTVELNPASGAVLEDLRRAGVNRVSVGVQALDDRLLAWLGRAHDARVALETLSRAAEVGFPRLSADLLYGVPGLAPGALGAWVGRLADRGVSHLSAYSLEVHPGTPLAVEASPEAVPLCPPEEEEAQWEALVAAAEASGFFPYEVSNFARPGAESRHNRAYWTRSPYLGLGPGAHSFAPGDGPWGSRSWNDPGLRAYGDAASRGSLPPGGAERLSRGEALLEVLFLAFRRTDDLCATGIAETFALDPQRTGAAFAALAAKGLLLERGGGRWAPSRDALRRADGLALWTHEHLLTGEGRCA